MSIPGEMEGTMFRKFCMTQSLRSLYNISQLPMELHPLVDKFTTIFNHDLRGTLLSEDSDNHASDPDLRGTEGTLSMEIHRLLVSWLETQDPRQFLSLSRKVSYHRAVYNHVLYRIHQRSPPDSHILYDANESFVGRPGYIEQIFTHERETIRHERIRDVFVVVRPYESIIMNGPQSGIFQLSPKFSFVPGFLFRKVVSTPILVHLKQIHGHFGFALTDYDNGSHDQIFQAIPLAKVCYGDI